MNSVSFQGNSVENNEDQDALEANIMLGLNNPNFNMNLPYLTEKDGHEVLFNVTFAISVPGVFTNNRTNESFSSSNSMSDQNSKNVQQFFHLEFDLFSKEIYKESFKTDIGFYGVFAKIYPDKSESAIIPTWSDGEDTWISWNQIYKYWITDDHVRDLCTHKMKLTIWDTKDKCAPKVRFDKPKAPRSGSRLKSTSENSSWIKQTVLTMSKDYSTMPSNQEQSERSLPHQIVSSRPLKKVEEKSKKVFRNSSSAKSSTSSSERKAKAPKVNIDSNSLQEKPLDPSNSSNTVKGNDLCSKFTSQIQSDNLSSKKSSESLLTSETNYVSDFKKIAALEMYNKNGRTNLKINMTDLFLKSQTLNRIPNSTSSVEDMFCKVSVESDILSLSQKTNLNPLMIRIKKIDNLPLLNKRTNDINQLYKPVFCQYQFSDLPKYRTSERLQKKSVIVNDLSIILLGEMTDIKIKEQFLNSFFTIQIFNRIKQDKSYLTMFSDFNDETDIGDINFTSAYKMVKDLEIEKPQGEARIDISDIIRKNLKFLEVSVPIVPISLLSSKENNEIQSKQICEDSPNFIEAETTIKISFQLFESLSLNQSPVGHEHFSKLIIINNNNSTCDFIRETCSNLILKYNCTKLNFHNSIKEEMQKFLYNANDSATEYNGEFVGFYVIDKKNEVLLVEGPENAMKTLYGQFSKILNDCKDMKIDLSAIKLLYNDSLSFKEIEHFTVLSMIPLILSRDISFFVSQPLLYVRDIVPKNCVEGICRLKDLLITNSMQTAIRNNLIPTSQMIDDLSKYFCSHLQSIFEEANFSTVENNQNQNHSSENQRRKQVKTAPMTIGRRPNCKSEEEKTRNIKNRKYVYASEECSFSYSCQRKNSISSALKEIKNQMDPKKRYTYSQDYLFSGEVDPVGFDDMYIAEERKSRNEPRWIHRGSKSTIDDYSEVNTLPVSRITELKDPWKENELHASFMKPTLPERDETTFKFDTYIRPLHLLDRSSLSIMPCYAIQIENDKEKSKIDYNTWKNKVCVSDLRFKTYRLLPKSELTKSGRKSSNQIDKLKGLRKDDLSFNNVIVKKYGDPNSITPFHVLTNNDVSHTAYTVGSESYRNLLINNIPVNRKDKNFKSVYLPSKQTAIFKNVKPKLTCPTSPFSMVY